MFKRPLKGWGRADRKGEGEPVGGGCRPEVVMACPQKVAMDGVERGQVPNAFWTRSHGDPWMWGLGNGDGQTWLWGVWPA